MVCICCGKEIDTEENMVWGNCQQCWEKVLKIYSNAPPDDVCLCTAACKVKCRRNISQYNTRNQIFSCADFSATCPAYDPKEER